MGFRTVVVTSHSRCSYQNNYMVIKGEEVKMIHLSEIDVVIFDTPSISITGVLMSAFAKKKIIVLCCNEKHLPSSIVLPLFSHVEYAGKLRRQIAWESEKLDNIWKIIVEHKIKSEIRILKKIDCYDEVKLLEKYSNEVMPGDTLNREGLAAKVYFSALFGSDFIRHKVDGINSALDYGYAIIISLVTRAIVSSGYQPALGVHHKNDFNSFNLSCDLMEPFRAIVDRVIIENYEYDFDKELKQHLWNIPNILVEYKGKTQYLANAIKLYCCDLLDYIETGEGEIAEVIYS